MSMRTLLPFFLVAYTIEKTSPLTGHSSPRLETGRTPENAYFL